TLSPTSTLFPYTTLFRSAFSTSILILSQSRNTLLCIPTGFTRGYSDLTLPGFFGSFSYYKIPSLRLLVPMPQSVSPLTESSEYLASWLHSSLLFILCSLFFVLCSLFFVLYSCY